MPMWMPARSATWAYASPVGIAVAGTMTLPPSSTTRSQAVATSSTSTHGIAYERGVPSERGARVLHSTLQPVVGAGGDRLLDHAARRQRTVADVGQQVHSACQSPGRFGLGRRHGGDHLAHCGAEGVGQR
jgi:hypothetical protein